MRSCAQVSKEHSMIRRYRFRHLKPQAHLGVLLIRAQPPLAILAMMMPIYKMVYGFTHRYASRVKLITNDAQKNQDNKEVARLKGIITKLKAGESLDADEAEV